MSDDPIDEMLASTMTVTRGLTRAARELIRLAEESKLRDAARVRTEAVQLAKELEEREAFAKDFYSVTATKEWINQADHEDLSKALHGVHALADVDPKFEESAARMREQVRDTLHLDLDPHWDATRDPDLMGTLTARHLAGETADRARNDLDQATKAREGAQYDVDSAIGQEKDQDWDSAVARQQRDAALVDAGIPPSTVKAKSTADRLNANNPESAATAAAEKGRRAPKARKNLAANRGAGNQRTR